MWAKSHLYDLSCFHLTRFANHENSKKHKENLALLKAEMEAEEEEYAGEMEAEEEESAGEDDVVDDEDNGEEDEELDEKDDEAVDSDEEESVEVSIKTEQESQRKKWVAGIYREYKISTHEYYFHAGAVP